MAGHVLRILAVVVALACGVATPAGAQSELIRSTYSAPYVVTKDTRLGSHGSVVGPELAGGHVVWGEVGADRIWRVGEASKTGARFADRTTTLRLPQSGALALTLSASSTRVAATLEANCDLRRCPPPIGAALLTWRYGEDPETLVTCPGSTCGGSDCSPLPRPALVAGDTVAYGQGCTGTGTGIVTRDLSRGGDPSPRTIAAEGSLWRAGGGYLVTRETGDRLVVYDVAARREAFHVGGAYFADVQGDGKLGFLTLDGYPGLGWASPAHPEPQWAVDPCYFNMPCTRWVDPVRYDGIRMAGNRFALEHTVGDDPNAASFEIRRLDGSVIKVGYSDDLVGGFDFDGERVTFMTQPCQTTAIIVWDIRDAHVPRQSDAACPPARAAAAKAALHAPKRLRLRLSCPRKPPLGCVGRAHLVVFARGHYVALGTWSYKVPYDHSPTVSIRLNRDARRFLAHHRAAKLFAASFPVSREDEYARPNGHAHYDEIPIGRTG
jgi:hypothetical protein